MLRNYLLTAVRNLRKHRLYSFITIGGLAVGLAACLMTLLFVRDELSYDDWLPNADRIATLEIEFRAPGREAMGFATTPGPAKAALEKDFSSDIERVVRVFDSGDLVRVGSKQFNEDIAYVDAGFFDMFDLPMVSGVREQALANNTSILLSERIAEKYFGDGPAIGQVMTIENEIDYQVVGVFRDLPRNTHLDLDMIALFDTERYKDKPWIAENWTSANTYTYVMFRSKEAMARVESDLPAFVDRNVELKIPGFENAVVSDMVIFSLMPVRDIHLYSKKPGTMRPGGDITTVITFGAIALLILLIACINFVNLATARSMSRAREVAMRKVVGAQRGQLVGQFLGEALLTALVALVIAVALVELALGPYNRFIDKQLSIDIIGDPALGAIMLGLVVVVGVLGGAYPAIYLSRFRPARVLKANQSSASGGTFLRNSLVVFQFAISIGLIVSTAIVYGQTSYARDLDLGFDKANKLVVLGLYNLPGKGATAQTLKGELAKLPHVRHVSMSSDAPPLSNNNNTVLYPSATERDTKFIVETLRVDADFFTTFGVEPLAGRVFSPEYGTDVRHIPDDETREGTESIIVNETFLAKLGYATPEEAIGVVLWDTVGPEAVDRLVRATIVGVVPDLKLRSVNFTITPMMYATFPEDSEFMNVVTLDVEPGHMKSTLAAVGALWAELAPDVPIRTAKIDAEVAEQYDAIEKRGHMFGAFALFAVLIACLGLFGLASFAAERRTKEIGVRKALGASVLDIVRLLMWQFSKPVLIANAIAWPVSFYVMNQWLGTFKYHIDLANPLLLVGVFGGAGLIAMLIAWLTVAGQAARVARASPILALRCE